MWTKIVSGDSYAEGYAVTRLSDDSTVVTGYFKGHATLAKGEANETKLTTYDKDILIARYNSDGTLAWVKQAGSPYDDIGYGITALSSDSTVVTGSFDDSAVFGKGEANETTLKADAMGYTDMFVARYNANGTLAWAKSAGGPGHDVGSAVSKLTDDSVVVSGWFEDSAKFGSIR